MSIILRPRQSQAILDLRRHYQTRSCAPILVAPTGFGKTATSVAMIQSAIDKGLRVWFMAHLKEILNDTGLRLTQSGVRFGYIWSGHLTDRRQQVQIVSVATAVNRLARLDKPDLIIVDEAHLAVAKSYQDVFEWCNAGPKYHKPGGTLLLHLTATPQRLDGRGMGEVADVIVPTCSTQDLIGEGLLAPVRYLTPDAPDMAGAKHIGGDFASSFASEIMSRPAIVGSVLDHYMSLGRGRPGLGFCADIKSAHTYADRFNAAGLRAVAISGDDHADDRDRALRDIQNGRLDFVFNCKLWVAGVDAPALAYIADLSPTESLTRYLQGLGRGLRTCDGKNDLMYADHAGNLARHGNPLMARPWTLGADPDKQKKGAKAAVPEKKCPACFASVHAAATHCACGHEFEVQGREIDEVDGHLAEVDLGASAPIMERTREQRVHLERAQTIAELEAEGRRRGKKRPELWARHVYKARMQRDARVA